MKVYNYDKITFQFTNESEANLDIVATRRTGEEVYLLPAYATFKKPPSVGEHKISIFDTQKDKWLVKDDYRGCYICDEQMNVQVVQEIGDLPEGFIVITEGQAEQIIQDHLWYIVQDGELIKNPNYEEDKAKERKEYISHLAMTKYDFYKYVCKPNDITYPQLVAMVNSNEEVAAAWNLCGHVYRGDEILCEYIEQFMPTLTEDVLDEIFENYGKVINE